MYVLKTIVFIMIEINRRISPQSNIRGEKQHKEKSKTYILILRKKIVHTLKLALLSFIFYLTDTKRFIS